MRISSISIAQPSQYNYKKSVKKTNTQMAQMPQTSFKGWKTGAGGVLGTLVGGAIGTFLSGGALLPILLLGSAGAAGGTIIGSSHDDDGHSYEPYSPNYKDY